MTMIDPNLRATRTTCPYCGVGCGVLATPDGAGGAAIAGDPEHPANFGRLCSKGSALGETLALQTRLLHPMIRCSKGTLERVAWTDALDHVAHRFQHIVARDGPDAVAFYLSGQLLTEDYYVANKLMKGFIGSANVDTNSRLCMASSVAGHRRAFGADTVPGVYEDLDEADLLVFVGSNAAWCHPVLFQRMMANKQKRGARFVVIDPRRTDTAGDDDLFLGLRPGTDTALFSGLLVYLADNGALDRDYIAKHTSGFDEALARARSMAGSVAATALATGLSESDVAAFFQMFRSTERVVTLYSQGVNQSAQGTDKVNAILNCHLATGRIGKPGASPFSLTGQPNAMGGREVGGLANQLAAHMGFTPPDIDRVRRFWKAPRIATHEGLKAVQMFEAIARGEIKALWVMGTNPAVSLPDADAVRAALKKLELFVVSENVSSNDTVNAGAHVLLPAQAWGEKSGTVTNSERRISRQRAFLPPPGETKPDWWIVSEVAKRPRLRRRFRFQFGGGCVPRTCRPVGVRKQRRPRFRYRRADVGIGRGVRYAGAGAVADAARRVRAAAAFFRRRRILCQRPQGAFHRARNSVAAHRNHGGAAAAAQHRADSRPVAYHDPHRDQRAAGPASAGAVRRDQSRRCDQIRYRGWRLRARHHRLRAVHPESRGQPASAARHAVCADPLERSHRVDRAGRRAGRAVHRSVFRPAENKATPVSIVPYEYVFRGFALSRTRLLDLPAQVWWARVGAVSPAATAICSPTMPIWRDGRPGYASSPARILRNTRTPAAASTARRRLTASESTHACSSVRRGMPATGAWSRTCSPPKRSPTINAGCCCRVNRWTAWPMPARSSVPVSASAAPPFAMPSRPAQGRGRDRRAVEGRHQLRLLHSGTEAVDRADGCQGHRTTSISPRGELTRISSALVARESTPDMLEVQATFNPRAAPH